MFNKRLRAVRIYRGFTQQRTADEIGIALRTYQGYEQGERQPSLDVLIKIADTFDVPVDYLLCRDMARLASFKELDLK